MGTDTKKNSFIKIRVSQEQKELYKEYAAQKNMTLTDLLFVSTEEFMAREKIKHKENEKLELRLQRLEKELDGVKAKMEKRRNAVKRFKWFNRV